MISYRELAMRALGKPLRDPASSPRPVAHRVTALALTAAMASALASPAFAGWTINMSEVEGNVTIKKDNDGNTTIEVDGNDTTIKVGSSTSGIKGVDYDSSTDADKITVTGNNTETNSNGNQVTLEAPDDNTRQPVVDEGTSGQEPVVSGQTDEEEGGNADPAPTPVVTWPDAGTSGQQSVASGQTDEEKGTDDPANEMVYPGMGDDTDGGSTGYTTLEGTDGTQQPVVDEESSGQESVDSGQTGNAEGTTTEETADPEGGVTGETGAEGGQPAASVPATLEAPTGGMALAGVSREQEEDADEPETYLGKAAKALATSTSNAINKILKIINGSSEELDVTLNGATIDATGTKNSALTVEGSGNTKLTLEGESTLTGDTGKDGLSQTGTGSLTITGSGTDNKGGTLNATGGDSNNTREIGNAGAGIHTEGKLSIEGGTVKAKGGNVTDTGSGISFENGAGISSESDMTISGGTIDATGGSGCVGGSGISSKSKLTVSGDASITAKGGSNNQNGNGSSGIYGKNVEIKGGTIESATGGDNTSGTGGAGIYGTDVTVSGGTVKSATGGNSTSGNGGAGISGTRTTIEKVGTVKNATGGNSTKGTGGAGIYGTNVTIRDNGTIENATGGSSTSGNGGNGINGSSQVTIKDNGKVENAEGTGKDSSGIYGNTVSITGGLIKKAKGVLAGINGNTVEIKGGTIGEWNNGTAADGTGAIGGTGIRSQNGSITISGDSKVNAEGTGSSGDGIRTGGTVEISGGTVDAKGGTYGYGISGNSVSVKNTANIKNAKGGEAGIHARSSLSITGGTIGEWNNGTATGGTGAVGAMGIRSEGSLTISGGKVKATGNSGSGIYSTGDLTIGSDDGATATVTAEGGDYGCGISGTNVYVKNTANIKKAKGALGGISGSTVEITGGTVDAEGTGDNSAGISGVSVTIGGNARIVQATGVASGISGGNVTIEGGTIENATGIGSGTSLTIPIGISSSNALQIKGGTIKNASGKYGLYGDTVTISGGTIENAEGTGSGIHSQNDMIIGSDDGTTTATVNAKGGNYGINGASVYIGKNADIKNAEGEKAGIYSRSSLSITGGTIENAKGTGDNGAGISGVSIKISGGTVNVNATDDNRTGIDSRTVEIKDGTVNVNATGEGSRGVRASNVSISGGNVTINGGSDDGTGIELDSRYIPAGTAGKLWLSGTANVTINMGAGGKALTKSTGQTTEDLDPDSVRANQSETLTIYDSNGNLVYPVASDDDTDDTPETPETPVISSDSDSGTEQQPVVITPAGVSGIDFTTLQGRRILVSADVHDTALVFITLRSGVNMHLTLGTLRQLRAQGITHITLHTLMQTTTFYLDDILSAHADAPDSTPVLLTHDGKTATLTVGGVEQ